jgi:hypothetical protein
MRRPAPVFAVIAIAVLAGLAGLPQARAIAQEGVGARNAGAGRLRIVVTGLPSGTAASFRLSGPGLSRTLTGPATLTARPGVYHARLKKISIGSRAGGVPSSSTAFSTRSVIAATVHAGKTTLLTVAYGTIRSSRDTTLKGAPLDVIGSPSSPTGLVLSTGQARRLRAGSIIVSPPTVTLPDGLFDRVVSVKTTHAGVALSIAEASLEEAFPQLSVDQEVNLAAPSAPAGAAHAAADEDGWELSLDTELIDNTLSQECAAPATQPLPTFTPLARLRRH